MFLFLFTSFPRVFAIAKRRGGLVVREVFLDIGVEFYQLGGGDRIGVLFGWVGDALGEGFWRVWEGVFDACLGTKRECGWVGVVRIWIIVWALVVKGSISSIGARPILAWNRNLSSLVQLKKSLCRGRIALQLGEEAYRSIRRLFCQLS